MAASLILDPNPDSPYRTVRVASQAYTFGDVVIWDRTSDSVDVVPITTSSHTVNLAGVAMQTVGSSATSLIIALFRPGQVWKIDSANNTNASHNYLRGIMTDATKINNTGSDVTDNTGVWTQIGYTGVTTDKKALVQFNAVQGVTGTS